MNSSFRHFSAEDIRNKIPMHKAIELMRDAFLQLSSAGATVPMRSMVENHDHTGRALFMPSYSAAFGLFGLKMVTVFESNESVNLPIIQGKVLVMDGVNGTPLALLDAEYLTALRTGAASGLATDLLARKNAEVLALFGTGAQAETQLAGVLAVRPVKEIIIFGKPGKNIAKFCETTKEKYKIPVHSGTKPEDLQRADVICTATTSTTPVFHSLDVKKGVHINGIGSFKPTMQEIPSKVIQQCLLIVDQREATLSEAGDIMIPIHEGVIGPGHIHAELGEIISGVRKGRTSQDQVTVFKSVGNAIQDLAIAQFMLQDSHSPEEA